VFDQLINVIVERADNWLDDALPGSAGGSTESVVESVRDDNLASLIIETGRDVLDVLEELVNIADSLRPK
jgi:hypothetical protein